MSCGSLKSNSRSPPLRASFRLTTPKLENAWGPVLHPGDEDLSPGTPVRSATVWRGRVRGFPPIPQTTRNGWGTEQLWRRYKDDSVGGEEERPERSRNYLRSDQMLTTPVRGWRRRRRPAGRSRRRAVEL